ncbi:PREDICTED: transmembrane protein 50A [Nicrophorus vespilloides]|uniref:Transmembrane protein 50A n=1 Tax=Nicrophorus vespilloides TaxID=110193 RepID=A0ABM1M5E8_NICVS|nr:PREDICTED: transmembrane protein 50A [Nicrophorus vespilloides]
MSSLLENLNIPTCIWFEGGDKRNALASIFAGFLFFTGWWILIDAASVHSGSVLAGYHMCGVFGTLSLIMVNSVSNAQIRGDAFEGGCMGPRGSRIWLFLGFVMGFASVIASCWILFADFVAIEHTVQWPGVALFIQNAFIFISSLIYKFGRSEDLWG